MHVHATLNIFYLQNPKVARNKFTSEIFNFYDPFYYNNQKVARNNLR